MPGTEFTRAVAAATRRYGRFSHAAHLHVAWTLLRERPALAALGEFRSGLRRLAADLGVPEKYHETRTVGWMWLVLGRMDRTETWEAFEAGNGDLFDVGYLGTFYPEGVLDSAQARAVFVVPGAAQP